MNQANLMTGVRIGIGYGLTALLLTIVVALGRTAISNSDDSLRHTEDITALEKQLSEHMGSSLDEMTRLLRTLALTKPGSETRDQQKEIIAARKKYDESFNQLLQMPMSDKGRSILDTVGKLTDDARKIDETYIALLDNDRENALRYLAGTGIPAVARLQQAINEFDELQNALNKHDAELAFNVNQRARTLIMFCSAIAVMLSASLGWMVTKSLYRQFGTNLVNGAPLVVSLEKRK